MAPKFLLTLLAHVLFLITTSASAATDNAAAAPLPGPRYISYGALRADQQYPHNSEHPRNPNYQPEAQPTPHHAPPRRVMKARPVHPPPSPDAQYWEEANMVNDLVLKACKFDESARNDADRPISSGCWAELQTRPISMKIDLKNVTLFTLLNCMKNADSAHDFFTAFVKDFDPAPYSTTYKARYICQENYAYVQDYVFRAIYNFMDGSRSYPDAFASIKEAILHLGACTKTLNNYSNGIKDDKVKNKIQEIKSHNDYAERFLDVAETLLTELKKRYKN